MYSSLEFLKRLAAWSQLMRRARSLRLPETLVGCRFIGRRFAAALFLLDHDCSGRIPGHTTRAPLVGFELETNGFHSQLGEDIILI